MEAKIQHDEWASLNIDKAEDVTRKDLVGMFHGDFAAIRIPGFLTPSQCENVVVRLRQEAGRRGRRFPGNLNLGSVFNIRSHWEFRYVLEDNQGEWLSYFQKVGPTTRLRARLFSEVGDPVKGVTKMLTQAWGIPVSRMRKFGKSLYVGMVRSGAPKLHFDWACFDLSEPEVVMQAGVNLYLANAGVGGDLKMYRTYGMTRGNTASSKKETVDNYDLPRELVGGVESCTVPCRAGDLVFAPNRFLHEVTQTAGPEDDRLTLSFHLVWMGDGRLAVFS